MAATFLVVAGSVFTPTASAQDYGNPYITQGDPVRMEGLGGCIIGYNDVAKHRSFVAGHCVDGVTRSRLLNLIYP